MLKPPKVPEKTEACQSLALHGSAPGVMTSQLSESIHRKAYEGLAITVDAHVMVKQRAARAGRWYLLYGMGSLQRE